MWIPPETVDPVVLQAATRKSVGIYGAVCLRTGQLVTRQEPKFNAETFGAFLDQLLCHWRRGHMMMVALDNARWHHAVLLHDWLEQQRHRLQLDFLPSYSPQLNPAERVWKLTRRLCTHNRYFSALSELLDSVSERFALWDKPNETLRQLCAII